jgi:predicted phosphodiesterase
LKIEKAIVIPDVHAPYHDHLSIGAVLRYIEDNKWDHLIFLGDFLDYFCISRFNEGQPGMIANKTIQDELRIGEALLQRFLKSAKKKNPKCKIVYLEGNHEARAYQFAMMFPHLKGLIEPEIALGFGSKDIKYIRSWSWSEPFSIGKAYFAHGRYTNIHHAKKMVEAYEENIFYGHVHDINAYSKTSIGTGKSKVGQSLGCLCDYPKEQDYTKGAPKNWAQSFATFYFQPNGHFNYYITRIFDHKFISPEGKLYEA